MAANKFCTQCGVPLEPGLKFCTNCGAPIQTESDTPNATIVQPRPARLASATQAPLTGQTTVAPNPVATPTHGTVSDSNALKRSSKGKVAVIVLVILLAVVSGGFAIYTLVIAPQGAGTGDVQEQESERPAGDDEAAETGTGSSSSQDEADEKTQGGVDTKSEADAKAEADAKTADEAFKQALVGYYNSLPDYDARIKDVASSFNYSYLSSDMQTRQNSASACSSLMAEVSAQLAELSNMKVPKDSAYEKQYNQILRCYQDHYARLSVMNDAWQIDLTYADPSAHKEEILRPISDANISGTNKNSALADYENVYPQIEL